MNRLANQALQGMLASSCQLCFFQCLLALLSANRYPFSSFLFYQITKRGQEPKKFPTVIEPLLADLESDIAAVVLSKARTIALIE